MTQKRKFMRGSTTISYCKICLRIEGRQKKFVNNEFNQVRNVYYRNQNLKVPMTKRFFLSHEQEVVLLKMNKHDVVYVILYTIYFRQAVGYFRCTMY